MCHANVQSYILYGFVVALILTSQVLSIFFGIKLSLTPSFLSLPCAAAACLCCLELQPWHLIWPDLGWVW